MSKHLSFSSLTVAIAIMVGGCVGFPVRAPIATPSTTASSPSVESPPPSAIASSPPPTAEPTEPAPSTPIDPTAPPAACASAQTQTAMNDCAAKLAEAADQSLNDVYQTVRDQYKDTPQDDRLIDAQLAWIAFRDANCQFASSRFEGGSIAPLIYSSCIERMTKERTAELKAYGTSPEEGNLF